MNMRNWVANAIASPVKQPLPILSFPSAQLLDVSVRELVCSSDLQAKGMKLVAIPLVVMAVLFVCVPSLISSVATLMIVSGAITIAHAWLLFRKKAKEQKEAEV